MTNASRPDDVDFYAQPILNSPYEAPSRHWQMNANRQPTGKINTFRRPADFITPVPQTKKRKKGPVQGSLQTDRTAAALTTEKQEYHKAINEIRAHVAKWRELPKNRWNVTPVTARLLDHWRTHKFSGIRPFFCQIEAVETAIWLTEVAPKSAALRKKFVDYVNAGSQEANPGLLRMALKMATGSGKTTVMAMLIAWQTLNAIRSSSARFSKGFLIVAPGITIRDRLRVLKPNDPNSYYASRELAPADMLRDLRQARIIVTNYHAFKLREKIEISRGTRSALGGWREEYLKTLESEGEMLQRVMPELIGLKNIIVINDEAHHCYREKPRQENEREKEFQHLRGEDRLDAKNEAKERSEAARVWISGLEAAQRKIGVSRVFDLSATPFFLAGSGEIVNTIFPWTVSDFSLMDAIESGIVKLPRIPVADNMPALDAPMYRNLWEHITNDKESSLPKKGKSSSLDPLSLPTPLFTALDALYGNYKETFEIWQKERVSVPPCFIIVCNNTSTSKLVYDYISGFHRQGPDGSDQFTQGRLELFRNFDDNGKALEKPRTLLIDSVQLERGEALDPEFREAAREEIARFRHEALARGGALAAEIRSGKELSDAAILREAMNTVGKKGQLGAEIRCVVSVGMLTEGWDANTVTHILGVRAFGSQLLCEQIIGRALRRQCYELNDKGRFDVEYADILGIPFDFSGAPRVVKPPKAKEMTPIRSLPERGSLEIVFPRVAGYRIELPAEELTADFNEDSRLVLTQEMTGATETRNSGIIGESIDLTLEHLEEARINTVLMHLTRHLLEKYRDGDGAPKIYLYGQLKRLARQWLNNWLTCKGGTYPGQLLYKTLADRACEKISDAITSHYREERPTRVILDPYNPQGSSRNVHFTTSKRDLWTTDARKCPINAVVLDSSWEGEFCRIVEKKDSHVLAYVKNHNLGFEVPYRLAGQSRRYLPDFIALLDDGRGPDDPLHLVVEIKGFRGEDAVQKKAAMENYWLPGVNSLGEYGRWDFLELRDPCAMAADFAEYVANVRKNSGDK